MARIDISDPELLRSKALPKGTYDATIEAIEVDYGAWGKQDNVQRFAFKFLLDQDQEIEEARGRTVSIMVAAAEGAGDLLLRMIGGFGVSLPEFDTDDWIGQRVRIGLSPGVNRKTGQATDNLTSLSLLQE